MEWSELTRITLGFIFLWSGLAKLRRPASFVESLNAYDLLAGPLVRPAAIAVVVLEPLLSIALLARVQLTVSFLAAAALLTVFSSLAVRTLRTKKDVSCGCLGKLTDLKLGWPSIITNATLIAAIALAIRPNTGMAGVSSTADFGAIVLWVSGFLLASLYWLIAYAYSVIGLMKEATERGVEVQV